MKRFHPTLPLAPERRDALAQARRERNRALGVLAVSLVILHLLLQLAVALAFG